MRAPADKLQRAARFFKLPPVQEESPLDNVADGLTQMFDRIRDAALNPRAKNLPPVHCGFIESGSINAVTFEFERELYALFYEGMYAHLHRLFLAMFAEPTVLPSFGGGVMYERAGRAALLDNPFKSEWPITAIAPRSDSREKLATALFNDAISLISAHEKYHILGGHFSLLSKFNDPHFLKARDDGGATRPTDPRTLHALELDADALAVLDLCRYLENRPKRKSTLFLFMFVISVYTRLLGSAYDSAAWWVQSHPPFFVRRTFMSRLAYNNLTPRKWFRRMSEDALERLMEEADQSAKHALRVVIAQNGPLPGLEYSLDLTDGPPEHLKREILTGCRDAMMPVVRSLQSLRYVL